MKCHGVCEDQAVVEIAEGLTLVSSGTARWLRRALDLDSSVSSGPANHPNWDLDRGELTFNGEVIRRVRILRTPSQIQQILDHFQSAGWPTRIDNPLTLGQQQLHETIRFLNCGLTRIRFHGPRGGRLKPDTVRRIFVREVIEPLAKKFLTPVGERGFKHGRLHSFRHYFCSTCANNGVPERIVMEWLGHADSAMIRHYFHLHDDEARRRMSSLDFLGGAGGRSAGQHEGTRNKEDVEPTRFDSSDGGGRLDLPSFDTVNYVNQKRRRKSLSCQYLRRRENQGGGHGTPTGLSRR